MSLYHRVDAEQPRRSQQRWKGGGHNGERHHRHLCISALASPAFYNRSGRLNLNMDLSIYRSGILVTSFTVVSSALPTLVTSPRLFRLSPVIQRHICVWTLFSLWVCSYHPHFSVQLQRRQRIYPMSTWLIIAFRHQSMVLPWEPTPPPPPSPLLKSGCKPRTHIWMI